jgi:hypothetical protein
MDVASLAVYRLASLTLLLTIAAGGILLFVSPLNAQSTNASLTGRITDSSKSVVPNALVVAINTSTRIHYETVTNATVSYYVADLPPGTYRIEVEKVGFKAMIKSDLVLHVQDALEINFEMVLRSASESVTVRGGVLPVVPQPAAEHRLHQFAHPDSDPRLDSGMRPAGSAAQSRRGSKSQAFDFAAGDA